MTELKEVRKALGLTQVEAAKYLDITTKTYAKYESEEFLMGTKKYSLYLENLKKLVKKPITVSSDDFVFLRENDLFYIDKTLLIKELLDNNEYVILFNRPRRFGKTLNLTMIKTFFDIKLKGNLLFEGLNISYYKELCNKYQNKYPVLFLNLKDVNASEYDGFIHQLKNKISDAIEPFSFLLNELDKDSKDYLLFKKIYYREGDNYDVMNSLYEIIRIISSFYKKKVVLIIDEYDIPLEKASSQGYYDEVVLTMRNLFSEALKTNEYLFMGILSGCLRISKESIFTGLNNIKVRTVMDDEYSDYYGFLEEEIDAALKVYQLEDKKEEIKEYYDGYIFKDKHIYCPFDVANYLLDHLHDRDSYPRYYWINSSSNDIIRKLLVSLDNKNKEELELLVNGGTIKKKINLNLSYRDLYNGVDNIYSVMVASGYLSIIDKSYDDICTLKIPNKEIRMIFENQILIWMKEDLIPSKKNNDIIEALFLKDTEKVERTLNDTMRFLIGVHDYSRRNIDKEAFYHGFLLGLLKASDKESRFEIKSNDEAGEGYLDISVIDYLKCQINIMKIKYAEEGDFMKAFEVAKNQINNLHYDDYLFEKYNKNIYIIIFYKKHCKIFIL